MLVAEDNPVNQRVAVRMLEKLGLCRRRGRRMAARRCAWRRRDFLRRDPDGLPHAGHRRLRSDAEDSRTVPPARRPPILAMTAAGAGDDRERCLAVGMSDYLSKPVQMHELRVDARALGVVDTDRPRGFSSRSVKSFRLPTASRRRTIDTWARPDAAAASEAPRPRVLGMRALLPGRRHGVRQRHDPLPTPVRALR